MCENIFQLKKKKEKKVGDCTNDLPSLTLVVAGISVTNLKSQSENKKRDLSISSIAKIFHVNTKKVSKHVLLFLLYQDSNA